MNIDISKHTLNSKEFSKLLFIYNAIEDGWKVKKKINYIIFQSKQVRKNVCIQKNI